MFNQIIDKYDFVNLAKEAGFDEPQAVFMFRFVELIRSNYNSSVQNTSLD